jgi:hypothetical protein
MYRAVRSVSYPIDSNIAMESHCQYTDDGGCNYYNLLQKIVITLYTEYYEYIYKIIYRILILLSKFDYI